MCGTTAGRLDGWTAGRLDGWTAVRQRTFLRALSQTGCVRDVCARAGISNTSADRMKKKSAAFERAWSRALAKAMPTIVQGGKLVGHKRRYSDSLLRVLLQRGMPMGGGGSPEELIAAAERAAAAAGGVFSDMASDEETDAAIREILDGILEKERRRLAHEAARASEEQGAPGGEMG